MLRSISAEWLKLRHSRISLVVAILPVISLLVGCFNFYFNQAALQNGWYSLWTQVGLFYGEFFLPILIAICCAYVCRLEHANRNWNMAMTSPLPVTFLFTAKLIIVGILIFAAQTLFMLLYWFAGQLLFSFKDAFPAETLVWSFRGWVASLSVAALQLGFSIRIRSFATPIGISLCAVFIGLGLYVLKIGMLFPYSLLSIGMCVLSQQDLSKTESLVFFLMNAVFITLFTGWSIRRLKHKDIASS
ncbi:ABC transporter permease subunit [Paenibacillus donghaensis]|uniref:ABC transporter permease n=1 Tax=Paenibacillus donghaensis TaxID=414771 RepID=UPI001883ECE1|nr:ABC transporter permease [Paenibacillus donghaensis]MBE9916937.1 ABC transporter permease subunit [Paenibacillus donghaensis]